MKTYTKDSLIQALLAIRQMGWIKNARPGNAGGVGNTLEDLLEIEENNLPIPNAAEWELKTTRQSLGALYGKSRQLSDRGILFKNNLSVPVGIYFKRLALTDSHGPANFFRNDDPPQVV